MGIRYGNSGGAFSFTTFGARNRYLLFEFTGGSLPQNFYGWAQLDVTFSRSHYPTVTLVDWAYDASGAQLPAGDTGTPEPSTLVLTGLATLALEAKGVRAWRAAQGESGKRMLSRPPKIERD